MKPWKEYPLYAQVSVDIHTSRLDKPFTYGVKEELREKIYIGSTVLIPFRSQKIKGYVIDLSEFPPSLPPGVKIKPIEEVTAPESLWDSEMMDLARWMSRYYGCTFLDALKVLVPAPVRSREDGRVPPEPTIKMIIVKGNPDESGEKLEKRAPKQWEALKYLSGQKGAVALANAVKESGVSTVIFNALVKKGLAEIFEGSPSFQFFHSQSARTSSFLELTEDQQKVFDALKEKYRFPGAEVVLLHGVTGSGKTEVYLRMAQEALKEGKEALILVPEISLTPQAVARFVGRFGEDVAVLHSRLTGLQRRQMWWNIRRKKVRVVLGARSAIFAPLDNIGLIVVDEEHDGSYKQDKEPRYHARQVAIKRAGTHNCLVILGSATPALESYHQAQEKKITLLELPRRVGESLLPKIKIVNLKKDFPEKGKKNRIIGDTLRDEMKKTISRGEQVILFLNRRGFSAFILCRECGNVIRCPYCDITLTYHRVGHLLKCHYCDYQRPAPSLCPFCSGSKLDTPALGIQKVEEELAELFPKAGIIRMDRDTTSGRDSHRELIGRFARREAQILLGTQMIAKGHDFPGVTLVGVVLADVSLYLPDFRSLETSYQILLQVSGRAGRRETQGKVIIQTYNPDTPVLKAVVKQDYKSFYKWEANNRQTLDFPPFSHIINLLFTGPVEEKLREYSLAFGEALRHKKFKPLFYSILGPSSCPLSRIKSRYRWHLVLKVKNVPKTVALINKIKEKLPVPFDVAFHADVDPMSLM